MNNQTQPILLNFVTPSTFVFDRRLWLLGFSIVVISVAGWLYRDSKTALVLAQRDYYQWQQHQDSHASRALDADKRKAQNEQIRALNRHIVRLNVPWDEVFKNVRPHKATPVFLLAVDANAKTSKLETREANAIRITAETSRFEVMTEYVDYLKAKRVFSQVHLLRHQLLQGDEMRYQFDVEAIWRSES